MDTTLNLEKDLKIKEEQIVNLKVTWNALEDRLKAKNEELIAVTEEIKEMDEQKKQLAENIRKCEYERKQIKLGFEVEEKVLEIVANSTTDKDDLGYNDRWIGGIVANALNIPQCISVAQFLPLEHAEADAADKQETIAGTELPIPFTSAETMADIKKTSVDKSGKPPKKKARCEQPKVGVEPIKPSTVKLFIHVLSNSTQRPDKTETKSLSKKNKKLPHSSAAEMTAYGGKSHREKEIEREKNSSEKKQKRVKGKVRGDPITEEVKHFTLGKGENLRVDSNQEVDIDNTENDVVRDANVDTVEVLEDNDDQRLYIAE